MAEEGTILEEREEYLVSPTGGRPTLRVGHFLRPSVTSIDGPVCNLPLRCLFSVASHSGPKKWPLKVAFNGWRNPSKNWSRWVDRMHSRYQSVWKHAGIHEAIMSSMYRILRDTNLVYAIAEKWCTETNTFVFPWAEATISLEDMIILGGYSVLGHSVSVPLETEDLEKIKEKLVEARLEITRTKAARASQSVWMNKFMESGSDIEHEAFLALWLSRFVFPTPAFDTISKHVFPIAIHLARGTRIALGPALLASLYRDLGVLKQSIVGSKNLETNECEEDDSSCAIWAPFQLIQIWTWERFPTLRQKPNSIKNGEPILARWHNVNKLKIENVGLAVDSYGECFLWRPFASAVNYQLFHKFYSEKEEWFPIDPGLDEELESFARCLRVCELVGVECIEQYLPHRVAMQFGMDQDLPGSVVRSNATPEIAWDNYNRPIRDAKLYIPPRLFESDVTTRYLEWWKKSMSAQPGLNKGVVGEKSSDGKKYSRRKRQSCDSKGVVGERSSDGKKYARRIRQSCDSSKGVVGERSSDGKKYARRIRQRWDSSKGVVGEKSSDGKKYARRIRQSCDSKIEDNQPPVPPGFASKCTEKMAHNDAPVPPGFPPKCIGNMADKDASVPPGIPPKCTGKTTNNDPPVPPDFPPRCIGGEAVIGRWKNSDGKKDSRMIQQTCDREMEDNHPPVPPGFPPKCIGKMVDKDPSVLRGFPPKCTGRTTNNDPPVPPGFPPRCVGVEARDSVDEDKLTLKELIKKVRSGDNGPRNGTQLQNPPSSTADNESLQSMDLMTTPVKKIAKVEPAVEGSGIVEEGAHEISRAETPPNNKLSIDTNHGETSTDPAEDIRGLDLEARIIRLEIEVAQLKAERFGNRFESTPAKGPSHL